MFRRFVRRSRHRYGFAFKTKCRTAFLISFLAGILLAVTPSTNEPGISTGYRLSVNQPEVAGNRFWYKDHPMWCLPNPGRVEIVIDEGGVIRLNGISNGSLWNLDPFKDRIDEILEWREGNKAIIEMYDDRAEYLGSKWVVGEYRIVAPAAMKYDDLIKIVDILMSHGSSSVIIEPIHSKSVEPAP
ncbi:MAG: hypothetical protein DWQ47_16370 [Acidobacteria bacterium]|nr:MAG: hypothetical protein DWQ32_03770 [Acidobacteriota bacterium]REK02373.1 MAG: hypothetical protein DWQ38_08370 [Acidobacteriota bacterium]REK13825.1 MAG: hypothetical protein DWQ43_09460 [Acidobacteriota bacterium]REK41820.1 MAG: hypothetical protein DWQ47_16370 [Acidobacteriota bacterium]